MNITGPFPAWMFRISPYLLFSGGLVMGANAEPPTWLIGNYQEWGSVIAVVLGLGFTGGDIAAYTKETI